MKRSLVFVIAGLLVVNAVLLALDLTKPSPAVLRAQQLEGELGKAHAENTGLKTEYEKLKVENDKLQAAVKTSAQPARVGTLAGTSGASVSAAAPAVTGQPGRASDPVAAAPATLDDAAKTAEALRKLTDTPQVRDMMRKLRDGQIDTSYGGLFKKLGLNDEELNRFKELLSDRQARQNDIMMKRMPDGLMPEQKKEHYKNITSEAAAAKKESDAAIHQFMNNEGDYQTFQQWEDTKPERLQVQMSLSSFDAADVPLSIEQRDKLLEVMVAARKASPPASTANAPDNAKGSPLAQYQTRQEARDLSIAQQAASFLSPEQITVLQKAQQKRRTLFSQPAAPAK